MQGFKVGIEKTQTEKKSTEKNEGAHLKTQTNFKVRFFGQCRFFLIILPQIYIFIFLLSISVINLFFYQCSLSISYRTISTKANQINFYKALVYIYLHEMPFSDIWVNRNEWPKMNSDFVICPAILLHFCIKRSSGLGYGIIWS